LDLGFGDHACEAVAAEQQAVAVDQGDVVLVDDDLRFGADAARQDVAVGVGAGLCGGDLAGFDHAVHEGVVVRQLAKGARSKEVGAAVTDVAEVRAMLVDRGGRERRAHPGDLAVGDRTFEDGAVG